MFHVKGMLLVWISWELTIVWHPGSVQIFCFAGRCVVFLHDVNSNTKDTPSSKL